MTKVINAVKTEDYDIIEGKSPIQYWRDDPRTNNEMVCRNCGSHENIGGGHVIGHIDGDYHICITPLCQNCNNQRESLPTFDVQSIDLVRIPMKHEHELFQMKENQTQKFRLIDEMIGSTGSSKQKSKDERYSTMAKGNRNRSK